MRRPLSLCSQDMLDTSLATRPESILWDDWHAVAQVETFTYGDRFETALFGHPLVVPPLLSFRSVP